MRDHVADDEDGGTAIDLFDQRRAVRSSVPTTACASGRVTRANTPTGVCGERPAASRPARTDGAAVMPM